MQPVRVKLYEFFDLHLEVVFSGLLQTVCRECAFILKQTTPEVWTASHTAQEHRIFESLQS